MLKKKKENNTNFLHQTDHLWMIPLSGFCLMAGEEDMVEKHFSQFVIIIVSQTFFESPGQIYLKAYVP